MDETSGECIGVIVCKASDHGKHGPKVRRGYIAMLAVDKTKRNAGLGTTLAVKAIEAMRDDGCKEIVLETELTNHGALRLYEKLGFMRDKRLEKYYLNGNDAFRLKLFFD
jgi:peptide alpha-N-acetyltransferase